MPDVRAVALEVKAIPEENLRGWPKTSGSRGMHVNVRIHPRVLHRSPPRPFSHYPRSRAPRTHPRSKWWKEERHGVFDYNQNAKDRTTSSAYSVRPLPDARVSAPLHWHEVPDSRPCPPPSAPCPNASPTTVTPTPMDAAAGSPNPSSN